MKPTLIVNDVHLGATRSAGSTPASASALRWYLQAEFRDLIMVNKDKDLLILGDLFDGFNVDESTLLNAYQTLAAWLLAGGNKLTLVQGNHDWSAKGDKLSSFHLLAAILQAQFGDQVAVPEPELTEVADKVYVIPHCANQDLFEMELQKALDIPYSYLLLHCNVMNPFADKADHSLNLTEEWADKISRCHHVIVAHEHQARYINMHRGISVLGNQLPSSVSDCLDKGGQNGRKFAHILEKEGISQLTTWQADGDFGYLDLDWANLADIPEDVKFIRVSGTATATQAGEVITAIAKLRSKSEAFVITNAVKVEGVDSMEEMGGVSLEQIQSFNVLGALLDMLEPKERATIQEVLSK